MKRKDLQARLSAAGWALMPTVGAGHKASVQVYRKGQDWLTVEFTRGHRAHSVELNGEAVELHTVARLPKVDRDKRVKRDHRARLRSSWPEQSSFDNVRLRQQ